MTLATGLALLMLLAASAAADGQAWHDRFEDAQQAAGASGRPILAAFHSVGCGPCAKMQQETLEDPEVAAVIRDRFEAVQVNALNRQDLATSHLVAFYPTVKFIDASGVTVYDCQGFIPSDDFLGVMQRALAAHEALQRARAASVGEDVSADDSLEIARDFLGARQYQQAADWARSTLERSDDDQAALRAGAQYLLGAALTEAGEPGRAEQPLVSALQSSGGASWEWDARLKLGYVWLQRGEDDSGIGLLQRVHVSEEAAPEIRREAARLLRWWGVEVD